ncbi:hypothetical protein E2562_004996 [Oryza meyeriana var. granulata]|uniref:Uncharacterized protein n=1 Tax=Oryza meyeriana var. granulata TaxID=110450 RepID=A0A6G1C443_9ORYZ|nr:hypothetical protein E2562_004996 [Oryza meyeriana var. granulata]
MVEEAARGARSNSPRAQARWGPWIWPPHSLLHHASGRQQMGAAAVAWKPWQSSEEAGGCRLCRWCRSSPLPPHVTTAVAGEK